MRGPSRQMALAGGVPRAPAVRALPRAKASLPLLHLYFVWSLTLFDFQYFLGHYMGGLVVFFFVNIAIPPMLLMIFLQGPQLLASGKGWYWYPAFLLLVITGFLTFPFAENLQYAKVTIQSFLIWYVLAIATSVFIRTPRQAIPIIIMLVLQFAWAGMFANVKGHVSWHPYLMNEDAYGPFMVEGLGLCFWFAMASRQRNVKIALFALAAFCIMGVVASYARGAFLSLVLVGAFIWWRHPSKVQISLAAGVAVLIIVAAALLLFDPGFFLAEMQSSFSEGNTAGTGGKRWDLWVAGVEAWKSRPIFGVGGGNFGAYSASYFQYGQLESFPSPSMLYGFNLHNAFVQVFVEFGLVGSIGFLWCLWDFRKRNKALLTPQAAAIWDTYSGGKFKLKYLAYGLEAANLANLCGGFFYATLLMPWFLLIWAANRMMWAVTRPGAGGPTPMVPLPPAKRRRG